ncbi:hypothetical protein ALC53_00086 [Atta colombica]|uniref:Uncharacterized protein n=1 Tax=Atta colombica TaxID=520822 RepID=A0A195BZ01_9HYME|nr:hypothetical protein ALC53_00086 [Atta colombica]
MKKSVAEAHQMLSNTHGEAAISEINDRGEPIAWLARSLALNPFDFYL